MGISTVSRLGFVERAAELLCQTFWLHWDWIGWNERALA